MSRLLFGPQESEQFAALGVRKEYFTDKGGTAHVLLTCVPQNSTEPGSQGLYLLWRDHFTRKWRWALRHWPDDDLGVPNHGAQTHLEDAVARCKAHHEDRRKLGPRAA